MKLKGMSSTWTFIILNLILYAVASVENEKTKAFIKLIEFDYEDSCSETAEAEWEFINSPSNETLLVWEEKLISYAAFKKLQKGDIANSSKYDISDPSLQYKYEITQKVGDALLDDTDFEHLIHFAGVTELQRLKPKQDVEYKLSRSNNVEDKRTAWKAWHQNLTQLMDNYTTILPLVNKAAKANDAKHSAEYWELLSSYNGGYEKIKFEWNRIADLHKKILKFVIASLSHKYNISINDTVPAHLLGSLQGSDWTPILVDATPYPELMYSIRKNLWKRKLIGEYLYKAASAMSSQMLSQTPEAGFWSKSRFNQQCPSKVVNFCQSGALSVSTCFEPTVSNYLAAHKNVGKILFNQISVEGTPILNTANRYSALEEGVSELFGILAASPAWLNHTRVMESSIDNEQHLIVSLMITALDTLPRLAYYISADMWRINALESGNKTSEELTSLWWKYREEYEGVNSNGTLLPTFLNDEYITSNKPYLPKIAGTILAFQLYEYLMESTEVRYDSIVGKQINISFLKMIQQGSADDWTKVVNKFLEIDQISSDPLLSFFSPLEDFIDDLDEDFQYKTITAKDLELEKLEKDIIAEMHTSSTTTTITTTTTTASFTTPRNVITKTKVANVTSLSKLNDGKSDINVVANSNKNVESKSSINVADGKSENHNMLKSPAATEVPFEESLLDSLDTEQDKKPKINTSKAVWAVGAVLLATIVICVIAIFGRRRCRKIPKNRRYE